MDNVIDETTVETQEEVESTTPEVSNEVESEIVEQLPPTEDLENGEDLTVGETIPATDLTEELNSEIEEYMKTEPSVLEE